MTQNQKSLFPHFSKISKAEWVEKATGDLKGEDVLKKYTWELEPGINVSPYYDPSDLDESAGYEAFHNRLAAKSDHSAANARIWLNLQTLFVNDAKTSNRDALEALNSGADGIIFNIANSIDFNLLLEGIEPEYCSISFRFAKESSASLIKELQAFLQSNPSGSTRITGAVAVSESSPEEQVQLFQTFGDYTHFNTFFIDAVNHTEFSESIAAQLKVTIQLIDTALQEGHPVEKVLKRCTLCTTIGTDYFGEIAKVRALRMLFFQVAHAYGATSFLPEDLTIRAISTPWTNETYQPHGNMLKGSTAAMGAILGGCDELVVSPEETDQKLMIRIARNISSILKEEAFLKSSADPVAGSYYLENLTDTIAQKAWQAFQTSLEETTV